MDESRVKRLLELLQGTDVEELELEHSFWRGTRVRIVRRRAAAPQAVGPLGAQSAAAAPAAAPAPHSEAARAAEAPAEASGVVIASPMVGTFYRSPSPDAPAFVSAGDRVHIGQTVGIIEAMKIMNEIHAEVEGEVIEILVANGDPVEYNQPLIRLRPL